MSLLGFSSEPGKAIDLNQPDAGKISGVGSSEAAALISRPVVSVLLVEDDQSTSAVMSRLLRRIGYNVRTADCISIALELAIQEPVDILISDIGLPDGSGYELMRELRQRGHTALGIALTGFDDQDDLDQSRRAGFSNHLVKPIDFAILQATLLQLKPV
jgi:CheY-like chemotaxis protein